MVHINSVPNTLGWKISDWVNFHKKSSEEQSLNALISLLKTQKISPQDPAWISLAKIEDIKEQWKDIRRRIMSATGTATTRTATADSSYTATVSADSATHTATAHLPSLYGVPVAIKDNIDVVTLPTTAGCPSFRYRPERDATVVSLLKSHGAIILGKTNLDQFATGLVGTRSPYGKVPSAFSADHVSGGSSSGSANVVARGIVPLALTTDTAGSTRVPAMLNNLFGLKPSCGALSCAGVVPACKSLDCVGLFTLTLCDAKLAYALLCSEDLSGRDCYSLRAPSPQAGSFGETPRVAIPSCLNWYGDSENPKLYVEAVDALSKCDTQVFKIDFADMLNLAKLLYEGSWVGERYAAIRDFLESDAPPPEDTLDPVVMKIIRGAKKFDAADHFKFEYRKAELLRKIRILLRDNKVDVLCVPTAPLNPSFKAVEKEPIKINSIQGTWTNFVNLADMCALSVPAGFRPDGMPFGITLVAEKWNEYALFRLAEKYLQKAFPNKIKFGAVLQSHDDSELCNRNIDSRDIAAIGGSGVPPNDARNSVKLAVVGAHLTGMPLHWQLDDVSACLLEQTVTTNKYRLYTLARDNANSSGSVEKPGLRRIKNGEIGFEIDVEVYFIPSDKFGKFMSYVSHPLGIGSVELKSGEWVKSFICEEIGYSAEGSKDISEFGGWRGYVDGKKDEGGDKERNGDKTRDPHADDSSAADSSAGDSSAGDSSAGDSHAGHSSADHSYSAVSAHNAPFDTVLIANRGEIAVRIIKTLKKLNIRVATVYAEQDKYSMHVLQSDISVPLSGNTTAQTYLSVSAIIAAAKSINAQAIIPGYGFLSENADFADKCAAENITFIGPSGDSIRKLGLKHSAREIASKAHVPLIPGSPLLRDLDHAIEEAKKLGLGLEPESGGSELMLKSTAGGGGIGLQRVSSLESLPQIFSTVKHQAQSYFNDSGVFFELFIDNARHVEVQILGDGCGQAIALGERDCSLQRRNQKIIEETPAPNISNETREAMRLAATQLATSISYKGAGTVEFIFDETRSKFYFLEVNARLQVEHPITEAVTGIDLVEWMVLIAANQSPRFPSEAIPVKGASMEARLYAENPVKDFRPSPGQLTEVSFPTWCRVDTWVEKGTEISTEYDPTIAKIIVHGSDRAEALALLCKALDETKIYGVVTNLDYLRSIAGSSMFAEAKMHTKVLDSYDYSPKAMEIVHPGAYTTVQDYPGRTGYWRIGVPPSGPMDSFSFRLANQIVGNIEAAPGIEITLAGPTIKFHVDCVIAVTGGEVDIKKTATAATAAAADETHHLPQYAPAYIRKGETIAIGKLKQGCRAYLAIRGGIVVQEYLGSRATFALGDMGGHNGRVLKMGDLLFISEEFAASEPRELPSELIPPIYGKDWEIGVVCGPHCSRDLFDPAYTKEFFKTFWKVHYNSNRFGVRLIGPKPKWSRLDGGEAGLHPSNLHDYVYSQGAINFTGDEPVIVTCDGPSLGGFVCSGVVADAEMWKVGQVKPGDLIQFVPISYECAVDLKRKQNRVISTFSDKYPTFSNNNNNNANKVIPLNEPENPIITVFNNDGQSPSVTYRQSGDRYILMEYGAAKMDLCVSYRIMQLIELCNSHCTPGIVELSQGVRSILVEFNPFEISQQQLVVTLINYERNILYTKNWTHKCRIFTLPMAFEDSQVLAAVQRYSETVRSKAPWLPNNVDFIASVNSIPRSQVETMLFSARFLVLGLGDVFLGAPCAVPLDPRHRFLGTKYNPSRTYTPNAAVGLGGMYMCIYTLLNGSPGGYQLVGRTVPIWDKLQLGNANGNLRGNSEVRGSSEVRGNSESRGNSDSQGNPWLLSPFDQIQYYPVTESELDRMTEDMHHGRFKVDVKDIVFDHGEYLDWCEKNKESIEAFENSRDGDKMSEFAKLISVANAELEQSGAAEKDESLDDLPENAELIYTEYSGRFWKCLVSVGDEVKVGQGLVVVEAMKTEMVVNCTKDGKVLKIFHKNGDMVEPGDVVVVVV